VAQRPFAAARDHVLLPFADKLPEADADLAPRLTAEVLGEIVGSIPDEWLAAEPGFGGPEAVRSAYLSYLNSRLREPRVWAHALEEVRREALA
jgi:hypothetical protein